MRVSQKQDNYSQLHGNFQWLVPEKFNIAQACCALDSIAGCCKKSSY